MMNMNSAARLNFVSYGALRRNSGRRSYWNVRCEKLRERLALEQKIYDERWQQWAISEELYSEQIGA